MNSSQRAVSPSSMNEDDDQQFSKAQAPKVTNQNQINDPKIKNDDSTIATQNNQEISKQQNQVKNLPEVSNDESAIIKDKRQAECKQENKEEVERKQENASENIDLRTKLQQH